MYGCPFFKFSISLLEFCFLTCYLRLGPWNRALACVCVFRFGKSFASNCYMTFMGSNLDSPSQTLTLLPDQRVAQGYLLRNSWTNCVEFWILIPNWKYGAGRGPQDPGQVSKQGGALETASASRYSTGLGATGTYSLFTLKTGWRRIFGATMHAPACGAVQGLLGRTGNCTREEQ